MSRLRYGLAVVDMIRSASAIVMLSQRGDNFLFALRIKRPYKNSVLLRNF